MSMATKKGTKSAQEKLRKERENILERLNAFTSSNTKDSTTNGEKPAWTDYGQKTDENAAEVAEYADQISLVGSLRARVAELDQALEAFSKGTYGICEVCGKKINEARIAALPGVTTCFNCKKKG